jgi:hypothetical protein
MKEEDIQRQRSRRNQRQEQCKEGQSESIIERGSETTWRKLGDALENKAGDQDDE